MDIYFVKISRSSTSTSDKMLGAGRVLSNKILKKLNYKIYDTVLNKGLDNTFNMIHQKNKFNCHEIQNPGVLLYKGKWECISNLATLLTHLPTFWLDPKNSEVRKIYRHFRISFPIKTSEETTFMGTESLV